MARQGLNATFSYPWDKAQRAYRVRANMLNHGMKIIFDESQSRLDRAFYPHRLSSAQFAVGVQLKGEDEYRSFTSWMATYAERALNLDVASGEFPSMMVSIPSHGFLKKGVPLSGYEWSDMVGAMVWSVQVVFETAEEPLDPNNRVQHSHVEGLRAKTDRDVRYFYPTGTQLSGNATPPDGTYSKVLSPEDMWRLTDSQDQASSDSTGGSTEGNMY